MTNDAITPQRAAHKLTHILDAFCAVHDGQRFPVDVKPLALDCANIFNWKDPITKVEAANIKKFEGALFPSDEKDKWLLLYNNSIRSPGRVRFTQAHELGHYILHRTNRDSFECSDHDMLNWSQDEKDIEAQADLFASYLLMPLNDFRLQINAPVDLDLMSHCATRYGVSLTAAILKWLSYTEDKAVLVMSIDGHIKWAWSSTPAFKSGAFFRTRSNVIELPASSIAANVSVNEDRAGSNVPANIWFPHAEAQMYLREMKIYADHYDEVITLLHLPRTADVWKPRALDESE